MLRLIIIALLVMTGCSSPQINDNTSWDWQISGKIYYKTPQERGSANLLWQHAKQLDSIQLSGPLGQGATRFVFSPSNARLLKDGKVIKSADNINELLADSLPWQIPIDNLKGWLASPQQENEFVENGWQVTASQFDHLQRPKKIAARHDDYQLTLLISKWIP